MIRTPMTSAAAALFVLTFAGTGFAQDRMNGRFVGGAGETVPTWGEGERGGDLGLKAYAGSYLPIHEGAMAKKTDETVKRQITEGFSSNGVGCDLVHQIIKDNASQDTAAKFDAAADNENRAKMSPFHRWMAEHGWIEGPKKSDLRERYLKDGYDPDAETWTGFCHNWAPAGIDPVVDFTVSMDKIYADVPFGIGDLRELATYTYPAPDWGGNYHWFGKRWNDKDNEQPESERMDPVDVLTILENYVGEGKPGIIFDVDPGYMVWNQPFHRWESDSTEVTGDAAGPKTPPPGGKAYKVDVKAYYGAEGHYANRGAPIERTSNWNMFIYTDANGKIVDSAWNGTNKVPDFAWINKTRDDNPDFARLERIAKEGISVTDIESFCKTMASLPEGPISAENAAKLRDLLDKICPVLDQNKVNDFVRTIAEKTGQDYTNLSDAIRSEVDARG